MTNPNDNGEVRVDRNGHVLTITIDRSTKLNGFTPEMFDALSDDASGRHRGGGG